MSTRWTITCGKCGNKEVVHTPRTTDGAEGEERLIKSRASMSCPKCGSKNRNYECG